MAETNADEAMKAEYRKARKEFLEAHPEDATGSPEEWPDGMKKAYNETIMDELNDL